ncbi:MAG: hypothetical protein Alpg2KO_19640 [Alphaproteobacteria bacterium]
MTDRQPVAQYDEAEMWSRLEAAVREHGQTKAVELGWDQPESGYEWGRPLTKLAKAMSVSAIALLSSTTEAGDDIDSSLLNLRKDPGMNDRMDGFDPNAMPAHLRDKVTFNAPPVRIEPEPEAVAEADPTLEELSPRDVASNADQPAPIASGELSKSVPFPEERWAANHITTATPGLFGFDTLGRSLLSTGMHDVTTSRATDTPLSFSDTPTAYAPIGPMNEGELSAHLAIERMLNSGFPINGELGTEWPTATPNVDFDMDGAPAPDSFDLADRGFGGDAWSMLSVSDDEQPTAAHRFEHGVDLQDLVNWQATAQMPDAEAIEAALAEVIENPPEQGLTLGSMMSRIIDMEQVERDQYLPMILSYRQVGADRAFNPNARNALSRLTVALEQTIESQQVIESIILANKVVEGMGTTRDLHYLIGKSGIESSFQTGLKAGTSSATGLFQFINSTWLIMVKTHGHKYGLEEMAADITIDRNGRPRVTTEERKQEILALRYHAGLNSVMGAEYTASNDRGLQARLGANARATDADRYLMHFFGGGDGPRFVSLMRRSPNAAAAPYFRRPARANRPIFYTRSGRARSFAQVYRLFERKTQSMDSLMDRTREPWLAQRGYFTWPSGQEMRIADLPVPRPRPANLGQPAVEATESHDAEADAAARPQQQQP